MGQSHPSGSTPSGGRVSHAASQLASRTSDGGGGEAEDADPHKVDVFTSASWEQVLEQVHNAKGLDSSAIPVKQVLLDLRKQEIERAQLSPSAVLLHVYDVEEDLQAMNHFLVFSMEDIALGGAFHVGVEVFGGEWSYGALGVQVDPPRSIDGHVYRCSILLGQTELTEEQVATELVQLCQVWRGKDYDMLDRNCCSFATRLCTSLRVSPMPLWVDRFARMLRQGRTAGRGVLKAGQDLLGFAPQVSRMLGEAGGEQHLRKAGARRGNGRTHNQRFSVSRGLQSPVADAGLVELPTERLPREGDTFPVGSVVEYESVSQGGWRPAQVVAYDPTTGCYDLNCRLAVPPQKVRFPVMAWREPQIAVIGARTPPAAALAPPFFSNVSAASAEFEDLAAAETALAEPSPVYAIGELVEYSSESQGCWVQARVMAYNAHFGTYDLDRRHGVPPERIRRLAVAVSQPLGHHPVMRAGGLVATPWQEPSSTNLVLAVEQSESFVAPAGLAPDVGGAQNLQPVAAVADADGGHGWQPLSVGTEVQYESRAHGCWLPAKVLHYHPRTDSYDLNLKPRVPAQKIRLPEASPPAAVGAGPPWQESGLPLSVPVELLIGGGEGGAAEDVHTAPTVVVGFLPEYGLHDLDRDAIGAGGNYM